MASPAHKAPAKGTHVLFILRSPNGITPVLSYLNSRSIKSWTATSLADAEAKIRDNRIQLVFLSLSLKNVSIAGMIEKLKGQFDIPIVIFSEETSRKIEGDMSRMATPNKIVPPNQNAKFLQMIQQNVGNKSSGGSGEGEAVVEDLLPANSEPIEGSAIPEQGRWLKINTDDHVKPPFTYKLIQPRSVVIGRTRYFFVGPKLPELSPEGRGWVASEGQFFVSGRIAEMAAEEMNASSGAKVYQFSQEEKAKPETPGFVITSPSAKKSDSTLRTPAKPNRVGSFFRRILKQFSRGQNDFFNQWNDKWRAMREKARAKIPRPSAAKTIEKLRQFASVRERIKDLRQMMANVPDTTDVINLFQEQTYPWVSREPANEIERAMVKSAVRAMEPPFKAEAPPDAGPTSRLCLGFIRSAEIEGFLLSDVNDADEESFALLINWVDTLRERLNRKLNAVELILPPTMVPIEPLALRNLVTEGSHFAMWADNGRQRLYTVFIPTPGIELPRAAADHSKLEIQAESIEPETMLMFDVFLHMPLNEKQIHFRRAGKMMSAETIDKLVQSSMTHVLINPEAEIAFFAYAAMSALRKPRG